MEGHDPTGGPGGAPQSEEELRAALEEQMRHVTVDDLLLQSVASLVNLTARRIAKPDERDLEQGKLGIDAIRALVDFIPGEANGQVRQALSELQMHFARASQEGGGAGEEGGDDEGSGAEQAGGQPPQGAPAPPRREPPAPGAQRPGPGGGEPPPRLWTPRGSS